MKTNFLSTINKYSLFNLLGVIIFKLLLDYSYITFISQFFAYMGFDLNISSFNYIISWVMYLFTYCVLSYKREVILFPSLLLAFLILMTPTATLYGLRSSDSDSFFIISISFIGLIFLIKTKSINIKYININHNSMIFILIVCTFTVLIHYFLINGFTHFSLGFSDVYELRSELGETQNEGLFGYFNNWVIKVFNVFLIIYFFNKKNYILAIIFAFVQVLLFALSGHKSVIVTLALIGLIYYVFKYKHISTVLIYSMVSFLFLIIIYSIFVEDILLPSILIRRAFFIPADLNYLHLEFFSTHKQLYWSNSILKYFLDYQYTMPATHIVADYIGEPDAAANTGYIGSGYMHFGIIGIFIYILLLSIVINILNSFSAYKPWVINSIILMPLLTAFISSDLMTSFLTHGLLIGTIILYLVGINTKGAFK